MSYWQSLIRGRGFKCASALELWWSSHRYHYESGFDRLRDWEGDKEAAGKSKWDCVCVWEFAAQANALRATWFPIPLIILLLFCFPFLRKKKTKMFCSPNTALSLWLSPLRWVARVNPKLNPSEFRFCFLPPAWGFKNGCFANTSWQRQGPSLCKYWQRGNRALNSVLNNGDREKALDRIAEEKIEGEGCF